MFTLVFNNCQKSLSNTIFVEGVPVDVPVSLPIDIVEYHWENNDLIVQIEHPNKESREAWVHTLQYLIQLLEPELVDHQPVPSEGWASEPEILTYAPESIWSKGFILQVLIIVLVLTFPILTIAFAPRTPCQEETIECVYGGL
jgi:hypothetical protein